MAAREGPPRAAPPGDSGSDWDRLLCIIPRAAVIIALAALCIWVVWGFIPALTWAAVIAIATWPLRERLVRAGLKPVVAAILLTLLWAVLLVAPVIFFGTALAQEAGHLRELIEQARRGQLEAPDWLTQLPVIGAYIADWWHMHLAAPAASGAALLDQSQTADALGLGRDVGRFIIRRLAVLGFTLLTLLFLYKDGARIVYEIEKIGVRLLGHPAERYGRYSLTAVRATVNGLVFVGLIEGILLGIGYAFSGVPHPVSFLLATAILGIVPFGAPVMLAVAALTLIAASRLIVAAVLFGVGLVVIFIIDHTLRPKLIGGSIKLPFLWALLGVFGGVEAFGIVGLFLGPAILAVGLAIWREAAATTPDAS
ncbi:MAG TPA: AI-2E family transporter [Stellaceae bacterium]|nr:AI-2E family transporter [Stellaceae bacterium]